MMIFGQLNRDHEKHSMPVSVNYIKKSVDIYAKYDVVSNHNCMDEHKETYYKTPMHKFFGIWPSHRKVMRPSQRVFIRGYQLICHPDVAEDIERTLREYTAKALNTVE